MTVIDFDRAAGDIERRRLLAQARRIRFAFTYLSSVGKGVCAAAVGETVGVACDLNDEQLDAIAMHVALVLPERRRPYLVVKYDELERLIAYRRLIERT